MSEEITLLIKKFNENPDEAIEAVWRHFHSRLVNKAKYEISKRPQRTKDEEDITAEALNSFYNGLKRGGFDRIENRDDLWRILVMLATRKAIRAFRDSQALKRGGGHGIRGESVFEGVRGGIEQALEDESELSTETFLKEVLERLASLDDPMLKVIAQKRLEGYSIQEIAKELEVVPRTIDRKIQKIKLLWQEEFSNEQ